MSFCFSASDPVAAYLDRFSDAPAVLATLGIDHRHDPDRPIGDGMAGEERLDRLAMQLRVERWAEDDDWTSADLEDLVAHLTAVHHRYLTSELPRLQRLARRLAASGNGDAAVLDASLMRFSAAILAHLEREEAGVFPACRAIARAANGAPLPDGQRLRLDVHDLETGHERFERDLPALRSLARGLEDDLLLPGVRQALVSGLDALADDLRQHHYEEMECLLPAALHCQELLSRPVRRQPDGAAP
jgi:iron-sulfur cluster repair protein YtfE (RIC family)